MNPLNAVYPLDDLGSYVSPSASLRKTVSPLWSCRTAEEAAEWKSFVADQDWPTSCPFRTNAILCMLPEGDSADQEKEYRPGW